ncbi:hypothetical protein KKC_13530, partial [Listeria fleischmannii subsp. coloradonensis]
MMNVAARVRLGDFVMRLSLLSKVNLALLVERG